MRALVNSRTMAFWAAAFVAVAAADRARAEVISGTIEDWAESGPVEVIGDGSNHVSMFWSINTFDRGWFYGDAFTGDSEVAHAAGVTEIGQITDASTYSYTSASIGPFCDADCDPDGVGEFVVWRNINTGHYGVLRIDDIHTTGKPLDAKLDGTWWFQTDGTGDFGGSRPDCTGDLDGSGDVGFADLLSLLSVWGDCPGCPEDLDGDGAVGFSDLLTMLTVWGPCE